MVDASGSDWMGRYIIKREYSEGSHHVFGLTWPQLGPISTPTDDLQPQHCRNAADAAASAPLASHADPQPAGTPECNSVQAQTSQQLGFVLSHVKAAARKVIHLSSILFHSAPSSILAKPGSEVEAELQPLGGQSSDLGPTVHTCINPDVAAQDAADMLTHSSGDNSPKNGSWVYGGLQLSAELNSLLAETADRLLHHSCGEGWLVQPRIANMSGLEYRVYLLGGASAVSACVLLLSLDLSKRVLVHGRHGWHIRGLFVRCAAYIAEMQPFLSSIAVFNCWLLLAICSFSAKRACIVQSHLACNAYVNTPRLLVNHFGACSCAFHSSSYSIKMMHAADLNGSIPSVVSRLHCTDGQG